MGRAWRIWRPCAGATLGPSFNHRAPPMAKKESGNKTSTLASKVLSGAKKPTPKETRALAASVLAQDETKGKRKK